MENKDAKSESPRLHKFVWIDAFNRAVVSDPRLGQAKILRCGNSLASKDNGDGFFCSRRELAERTGVTEDEAKKAIQILVAHGWIRRVRRGGRAGNGQTWASEYVLTIPVPTQDADVASDSGTTSTGERQEVKGGIKTTQGGSYSPPIRPSLITPSIVRPYDVSQSIAAAVEKEEGERRAEDGADAVDFREPPEREGGEWQVQVWRCPACHQGGPEEVFQRTAMHLTYVCSEGFLVEVPYTSVPQADRGYGSHYQVAENNHVDPVRAVSLANEV